MSINVETIQQTDTPTWDAYVHAHPHATLYHLSGWQKVIEKTYGHKTYYLIANKKDQQPVIHKSQQSVGDSSNPINTMSPKNPIVGILPLVLIKHFLFCNSLISIPFFDLGGILADSDDAEKALLYETMKLGQKLKVNNIELRHLNPLSGLADSPQLKAISSKYFPINHQLSPKSLLIQTRSHKVRMLLDIPGSSEVLMKSFKSKLRSQIKKTLKEGLKSKVGGLELLDNFYDVFLINMRDLGSPVHSKKLIRNVLEKFPGSAKIVVVYKDDQPMACSVVLGFKDTLENPWASALRKYSKLSPNMLLYWTMLEYACDNDFSCFDFGRSSPDESTYKFKEQWGAKPTPLHWHYISLNGKPIDEETSEKTKFDKAIQCWQKLPVPITRIIGPKIRKYIGL